MARIFDNYYIYPGNHEKPLVPVQITTPKYLNHDQWIKGWQGFKLIISSG